MILVDKLQKKKKKKKKKKNHWNTMNTFMQHPYWNGESGNLPRDNVSSLKINYKQIVEVFF